MHELYFLGMDIVEETRTISKFTETLCTDGMTEGELMAYKLGIENALSALKSVIERESEMIVVDIEGFDIPTELTIDELQEYYLKNRIFLTKSKIGKKKSIQKICLTE